MRARLLERTVTNPTAPRGATTEAATNMYATCQCTSRRAQPPVPETTNDSLVRARVAREMSGVLQGSGGEGGWGHGFQSKLAQPGLPGKGRVSPER